MSICIYKTDEQGLPIPDRLNRKGTPIYVCTRCGTPIPGPNFVVPECPMSADYQAPQQIETASLQKKVGGCSGCGQRQRILKERPSRK